MAGQNLFLINTPAFARSALRVGDGEFVIETTGHREQPIGSDGIDVQPPPQFVRSATLDGKPLAAAHLSAVQVHRGGVLRLELGSEPSGWGARIRPPSSSAPSIVPGGPS